MKSFSLITLVKSKPLDLSPLTTKFESRAKIDSNYQLNDVVGIKILDNIHAWCSAIEEKRESGK